MRYRSATLLVLILCTALALGACGGDPDPTTPPNEPITTPTSAPDSGEPVDFGPPSIRGVITDVEIVEGRGTIMVEGAIEPDTSFDKASVRFDFDTQILERDGDQLLASSAGALSERRRVEVFFTGPVRESYPVQADARIVIVLR